MKYIEMASVYDMYILHKCIWKSLAISENEVREQGDFFLIINTNFLIFFSKL